MFGLYLQTAILTVKSWRVKTYFVIFNFENDF